MMDYENLNLVNKSFEKEFASEFQKFLNKGWYILGENVARFEEEFANYNNIRYCVGVASGLDALIMSIKVLRLSADSQIIVPANTYIATIISIIQNGFEPILVEPDIHTYNIDPNLIEESISKKTKAIMVVHLYGKPCDMDKIKIIAQKHKLAVIEDCAQAHGAEYKGQKIGTFGNLGAFSFYPTKNLGCLGDGGCITLNNRKQYDYLKMLRNYGSEKKYYNKIIGMNSRLDELQACFLRVKLKSLDKINAHKRKIAAIYDKEISNERIIKPVRIKNCKDVFHIYPVRCESRDKLKEHLLTNGIKTEIHYPVPPHKQAAYKKRLKNYRDYPISEKIHDTILSLPISYAHNVTEINKVCEVINKFK